MNHHPSIIGTITGFSLAMVAIPKTDIETTVILAIIGAASGFLTTLLMKKLCSLIGNFIKNRKK